VLSREDFVFTIGYDGPQAVVDKFAKRKYGKLTALELADKGFFRAAYSSAVYSGNEAEIDLVTKAIGRLGGYSGADLSALNRLFGVVLVDVKRSIYI